MAAATLEAISEGIVVADAEAKIQYVNPAFTQMTGYSTAETVGRTLRLLESGRHDATFYQRIETALHGQGEWRGEIWHRQKDGEIYPQFMVINAIKGDRERCLEAGMDEYLSKPLQVEGLFSTIARLTAQRVDATGEQTGGLQSLSSDRNTLGSPAGSLIPEVPFDKAELLARVGGDHGLLQEIVGLFLEEGPVRATEIRDAIERMDGAALSRTAHALKGAVSLFGAKAAIDAALKLEQLGREGDLTHAHEGYRWLERAMSGLIPALEALLSETPPCGS